MSNKRILLKENDLLDLLSGKIVEHQQGIQIALSDIGYDRILKALRDNSKPA